MDHNLSESTNLAKDNKDFDRPKLDLNEIQKKDKGTVLSPQNVIEDPDENLYTPSPN